MPNNFASSVGKEVITEKGIGAFSLRKKIKHNNIRETITWNILIAYTKASVLIMMTYIDHGRKH